MSVLVDDHWATDPVWAPVAENPSMHGRAYLVHAAAVQWCAYWRVDDWTIPRSELRRLPGWSKKVQESLEALGIIAAEGERYRIVRTGLPPGSEQSASARSDAARRAAAARWAKERGDPPPDAPGNAPGNANADAERNAERIANASPPASPPSQTLPPLHPPDSSSIAISPARARGRGRAREEQRSSETSFELVVRVFSEERKAAGGGAFVGGNRTDYERIQTAAQWAEAEGEELEPLVRRSVRAFLEDPKARAERWPFSWWANDPGRYASAPPKPENVEELKHQVRTLRDEASEAWKRGDRDAYERLHREAAAIAERIHGPAPGRVAAG